MAKTIERELKTLLNKEEYQKLFTYFALEKESYIAQSNYYYDTVDELFKQNNAALRLRIFGNGQSEWTIKVRVSELESIELTQFNTEPIEDIPTSLNKDIISAKDLQDFIAKHHINWSDIQQTMALSTKRYQIDVDYGLYALDHTQYREQEDYELELESNNIANALVQFNSILKQFDITYQQAETKLARAHRYLTNE